MLRPEWSGGLVFYEKGFFGARSGAGPHFAALAYERPVFARIEDLGGGALQGPIGDLGFFPYLRCMAYALSTILAIRGSCFDCLYCLRRDYMFGAGRGHSEELRWGTIKRNISGERDQQLGTEPRK